MPHIASRLNPSLVSYRKSDSPHLNLPQFSGQVGANISERNTDMPRPRHNYSESFRKEAVDLLLNTKRPLRRVASELGISPHALRSWRDRSLGKVRGTEGASTKSSVRSAADLADPDFQVRSLKRENDVLRRDCEILKKALSILSKDPQRDLL